MHFQSENASLAKVNVTLMTARQASLYDVFRSVELEKTICRSLISDIPSYVNKFSDGKVPIFASDFCENCPCSVAIVTLLSSSS